MLKLIDIKKNYVVDKHLQTQALKGISLEFGENGFVAILGPSGCGKTTLLNIISGLDRYTSGDLIIDGKSTKLYTDRDWDDYRNKKIGIVFQSYNLIPHLNIIENTELSLTLAGISQSEKKERALQALDIVGLKDQARKKPNQLSGGQQQRVAIARAIISNPSIVLADEPTGALDSETSVQVMDILHKLSKDHLIIMVTHNEKLAYTYADRIIKMQDGLIESDSLNQRKDKEEEPVEDAKLDKSGSEESNRKKNKAKKSRMSFLTAMIMSLKNLATKKGRTIITAIASSFGIIGVGLVLAISGGFSNYVTRMETQTLSKFPITIEGYGLSSSNSQSNEENTGDTKVTLDPYPDGDNVHIKDPGTTLLHINEITSDYYDAFLLGGTDSYGRKWDGLDKSLYASIQNNYSISANVISKSVDDNSNEKYTSIDTEPQSMIASLTSTSYWSELPGDEAYIEESYDILPGGRFPKASNEVVITVDKYNQISTTTLKALGINPNEFKNSDGTYKEITTETFNNMEFKLVSNDDYYTRTEPTIDSPYYIGLGLRGAGKGNKDNPYAFPKLIKYMSSGISNDATNEEKSEYLKGLLNFFVDVEDGISLKPSQEIKLASLATSLTEQLKKTETEEEKTQVLQSFIEENESFFKEILGEDINIIKSQLATYSAPSTNEALKAAFENENSKTIKIVGILRKKEQTSLGLLGNGVYYLPSLTQEVLEDASTSKIALENDEKYFFINLESLLADYEALQEAMKSEDYSGLNAQNYMQAYNILSYDSTTKSAKKLSSISGYSTIRTSIGTDTSVGSITIYPIDFKTKESLLAYLDLYNTTPDSSGNKLSADNQIVYTDVSSMLTESIGTMVSVISTVLICFASISLVVSSVMIGIIIYTSVLERTKEIGILRSVGARKKDIGRLFKMESVAIGFIAGAIGVIFTYILSIPVNMIINAIYAEYNIGTIAELNPLYALLLIVISSVLTYISGLIPSRSAAKKNPVSCLRSE